MNCKWAVVTISFDILGRKVKVDLIWRLMIAETEHS